MSLTLLKLALIGQLIWVLLNSLMMSMCGGSRTLLLSIGMYIAFDAYLILRGVISRPYVGNSSSIKKNFVGGAALLSAPLLDIVMLVFLDFVFPIIRGCAR